MKLFILYFFLVVFVIFIVTIIIDVLNPRDGSPCGLLHVKINHRHVHVAMSYATHIDHYVDLVGPSHRVRRAPTSAAGHYDFADRKIPERESPAANRHTTGKRR